jgi:hypothetical protein
MYKNLNSANELIYGQGNLLAHLNYSVSPPPNP